MSPWTERQVRFLESSGSPLTVSQKRKMNRELHEDPSLGHKQKGSPAMKKVSADPMREMRIEIHRGPASKGKAHGPVTGFTVHHQMAPKPHGKSQAFYEDTRVAHPFSADEHDKMIEHVSSHLNAQASAPEIEAEAAGDHEKESKENAAYDGE